MAPQARDSTPAHDCRGCNVSWIVAVESETTRLGMRLSEVSPHVYHMFIWTFGLQIRQSTFACLIPVLPEVIIRPICVTSTRHRQRISNAITRTDGAVKKCKGSGRNFGRIGVVLSLCLACPKTKKLCSLLHNNEVTQAIAG